MAVTTYPATRRSWIDVTAADVTAGLACPGQLIAAFANNDQYLHDILIGRDTDFSAQTIPHDHQGANERTVAPQSTFNILPDSAPSGGPGLPELDGYWFYDRKSSKVTANGFQMSGVGGASLWQYLVQKGEDTDINDKNTRFFDICKCAYGARGKLTVSLYARLAETPPAGSQDAGMVSFGVTDGEEFLADSRVTFHWSDFTTTTWKRFYGFIEVGDIEDGARFVIVQSEQASIGLYITAIMCSPGHRLGYWQPARLDRCRHGAEHWAFGGYGLASCPVAEKATSITNAVRLYPG